jgi:hypothetical protein
VTEYNLPKPAVINWAVEIIDMIWVSVLGLVCLNKNQAINFVQLMTGCQESHQRAHDHP